MARGKVQMKKIENPVHRQVTFCKRRTGLFKKAKELSVLCDAEIGVFVYSSQGKLYELSTKGNMQGLVERYMKSTRGFQADPAVESQLLDPKGEISKLKQEIEILQKGFSPTYSYMFGGGTGTMTLDELQVLEKNLEIWIYHIRSAKMDLMFQEIQLLRNKFHYPCLNTIEIIIYIYIYIYIFFSFLKEGILNAANKHLQDKIEENTTTFDFVPFMTDSPYPLTIQNDLFQF